MPAEQGRFCGCIEDDPLHRQFRALAIELGPERAAKRVGLTEKAALRFLARFPVRRGTRDRIALFFATCRCASPPV
jgi:hypothetical protein